jgi:hypothetical protein
MVLALAAANQKQHGMHGNATSRVDDLCTKPQEWKNARPQAASSAMRRPPARHSSGGLDTGSLSSRRSLLPAQYLRQREAHVGQQCVRQIELCHVPRSQIPQGNQPKSLSRR